MNFKPNMLKIYFVAGTQDVNTKEDFLPKVEEVLKNGATAFQLREKGYNSIENPTELLKLAQQCRELTRKYNVPFFIDDDVDLAIKVQADGIHVGQKDEGIESVLKRIDSSMMIGLSCNTEEQVQKANLISGIDYLGTGAVFDTTSKADAGAAIGTAELKRLVELSRYPVVAIGGIDLDNLPETMAAGVEGFAAISLFTRMNDVEEQMKKIKAIVG
ncbi:thiamine phosphate synthase [Pediococcus stilesii]|uniref:Thiamine-phosphate synthase n=1 Tax=Pediococcus stilesii TaxID=331679 RepID=A0A0R2L7T6_9LACO|nr:thiamine phosphate synthase [Pediococcus stilesii]KRN94743.1 thiamine monophosphate synthase [Pediococcus stilesii]